MKKTMIGILAAATALYAALAIPVFGTEGDGRPASIVRAPFTNPSPEWFSASVPASMAAFSLIPSAREALLAQSGQPVFEPALGSGIIRQDLGRGLWSTAFQIFSVNMTVWAVDRYVERYPWSRISEKTIRQNFQTGFVWDVDGIVQNFLFHPLHGSAYFNAARKSGLSFWASIPFALAGSGMWEAFMEVDPPSINDIVNTTAGGVYLGEILGRVSNGILDGRARGIGRAGREIFAFILNPMGGPGRLFSGRMFRHDTSSPESDDRLGITINVGRMGVSNPWGLVGSSGNPVLGFGLELGDPFGEGTERKPFDFFRHRGSFYFGQSFATDQEGYGLLVGKNLSAWGASQHMLGIFLHFDLHNRKSFRMGGESLTGGLLSKFNLGSGMTLETAFHLGGLLVGSCANPHIVPSEPNGRDYNFGSGATLKGEAKLSLGRWGTLQLSGSHFLMAVLDGTAGTDRVTRLEASLEVPIYGPWSVGFEYVEDRRDSVYKSLPRGQDRQSDFHLIAAARF